MEVHTGNSEAGGTQQLCTGINQSQDEGRKQENPGE